MKAFTDMHGHCVCKLPSTDGLELTVYRNGTFTVAFPEAEGKCGVFGKQEFRYDVWFTAGGDDLDHRGFIVDNADINRYFVREYGPNSKKENYFTSCELIGVKAIADFRTDYPMARKILVRIWGLEDVTYVETKWEGQPNV